MSTLASTLALLALSLADPQPIDVVTALETAVTDAIAKVEPSVVAITRTKSLEGGRTLAIRGHAPGAAEKFIDDRFDEEGFLALPGDFGSGVVIGENGEILTLYHLLEGAALIRVRANDRQEFDAEIIAADPRSDLAVIVPKEGRDAPKPKLTPIAMGFAESLRKGTFLIALGNPYNTAKDGKASASMGILSNTARRIIAIPEMDPAEQTVQQRLRNQPTLLQLDSKLNLGMSGGAVVNLKGELVGITTTGGSPEAFDAQAGYAIPMDRLGRRIVGVLSEGREVEYGLLGIMLDQGGSNRVAGVRAGTPANEVDLRANDLIVAVGGVPVADREEMSLAISAVPVGTPVTLRIRRGEQEREINLTIAKFPPAAGVIATAPHQTWRGLRVDFASTLLAGGFTDDSMRNVSKGGVSIVNVAPGSPAAAAELKPGQIITEVAGKPIRGPADFFKTVSPLKGPVTLTAELGPEPHMKVTVK
jgi:S1-C subfamily serine protease